MLAACSITQPGPGARSRRRRRPGRRGRRRGRQTAGPTPASCPRLGRGYRRSSSRHADEAVGDQMLPGRRSPCTQTGGRFHSPAATPSQTASARSMSTRPGSSASCDGAGGSVGGADRCVRRPPRGPPAGSIAPSDDELGRVRAEPDGVGRRGRFRSVPSIHRKTRNGNGKVGSDRRSLPARAPPPAGAV